MAIFKLLDFRRNRQAIDSLGPYQDIVPIGVNSPADEIFPDGWCRGIHCSTGGTFTGVTARGKSRTVTMVAGEELRCVFRTVTAIASGTFEALY
jgi:hypothetical protein